MVIDGNSYFKYASIKALVSLDLLDVFHALKSGAKYKIRNYLLTSDDLEFVSEIMRERVHLTTKK